MKSLFLVIAFLSINSSCCVGQMNRQVSDDPDTKNFHQISYADKIYGLSRFWQEVNYNFVYLDKVNRNSWDSLYKSLIIDIQQTNDYQYYRMLQRFCAFLKDGHTNVYYPEYIDSLFLNSMFGNYRLFFKNIEDKAILIRVNASKKDELPLGSELIEVNGYSTRDYIEKYVAPYISSSTDYVLKDWSVNNLLKGLKGDKYIIKLKTPKGKIIRLDLTHEPTKEEAVYPEFEKTQLLDFKWYPNQVAYVALNSFENPAIDTLFEHILPELQKAKGLIIDLRNNGGGNTDIGTAILRYLTNDSIIQHSRYYTRQHLAAFKAWGVYTKPADTINNEWNKKSWLYNHDAVYYSFDYSPDTISLPEKRIVVPTVLLVGHFTASAAEDFLIAADNQKHMIRIGERSFGSTGQPYVFELPGRGTARVCSKKDTYPDGSPFVGVGIVPAIEVRTSLSDYLLRKDPFIEKALAWLKNKKGNDNF